jgi:hypothetical protein
MSKIFLGVIGVLLFAVYYFFSQNQILVANNVALENAVATQEETIKSIKADFALQTKQLQDLTIRSQKAQRELNRYTQFIQNYELASKILADPVEYEVMAYNMQEIKRYITELKDVVVYYRQVTVTNNE